jgi:hypothetical protein
MTSSTRVISILMLLAGLSLGVFASRALRAARLADTAPAADAHVPARIEQKVDLYQRAFGLDAQHTDQVRQQLQRYDRDVRNLLLELRQHHAKDFEELRERTETQITRILKDAGGH